MLHIIWTTNNPPVGNQELINCFEYVLLPAVYQYNVATSAQDNDINSPSNIFMRNSVRVY